MPPGPVELAAISGNLVALLMCEMIPALAVVVFQSIDAFTGGIESIHEYVPFLTG